MPHPHRPPFDPDDRDDDQKSNTGANVGRDKNNDAFELPMDEATWLARRGFHHDFGAGKDTGKKKPKVSGEAILDPKLDKPSGKPSDLDLELDPLLRLEENHSSIKSAILFAVMVPVVTFIAAGIIAVISRATGGPLCDGGYSTWICSRAYEIAFPVIPGIISYAGLFTAAGICYHKWKHERYWMPWLGIMWFLVPFTLAWATGVGTMAVVGHHQ